MPANLVYQLALTRAEAGQYEPALALFKDRFFASEEGGTTSGQVLFEVKLMQAEASAKAKNCAGADGLLEGKQPGMGLDGRSTREYLKLAGIARFCNRAKEAEDLLRRASAGVEDADLVWAIEAQKSLGTYDPVKANQQLTKALAEAERSLAASTHSGYWQFTVGMLQTALNQKERARDSFEKTLILADNHMSHHLAREALANLSAAK
jgi:tetratricopeptide (TPR) repeat protein